MTNLKPFAFAFLAATTMACSTTTSHVDVASANERIASQDPEPLAAPIPIVSPSQTLADGVPTDSHAPITPTYSRTLMRMPLAHVPTSAADAELERLTVRRRISGGLLVGFSSPLLVTGTMAFALAGRGSDPLTGLVVLTGIGMTVGGLGMFIPGVIFLSTKPTLPDRQAQYRPSIKVGPAGINFSGAF